MAFIRIYFGISKKQLQCELRNFFQPIYITLNQIITKMAEFKDDVILLLQDIDAATTQSAEFLELNTAVLLEVEEDQAYQTELIEQLKAGGSLSQADREEIIGKMTAQREKLATIRQNIETQAGFLRVLASNIEKPVPENPGGGGETDPGIGEG